MKVTEKVTNCVISIYALLKILKTIWQVLQYVLIRFCFIFFSKLSIYYKKYGVIIYDFSWKVWAPLLKMTYQKLYYSLTWINVYALEKKKLNHPSPPSPFISQSPRSGCFPFFPISFTLKNWQCATVYW